MLSLKHWTCGNVEKWVVILSTIYYVRDCQKKMKRKDSSVCLLLYLTDLFTWRLVLCALAQVFNTLVFGQVVLLLGHILPIIQHFMQQFSVTREEEKNLLLSE